MATQSKPEPGTAVATTEQPARPYVLKSDAAQLLYSDAARAAIAPMLRPGEDYDRVIVEVYHLAKKQPDIMKCAPETIVGAVARAVGTGLIIGETVHLVPFGSRLEMVLDYKGAIELVQNSGAARYVDAQCVYANEQFEFEQGTSPFIRHRPLADGTKRGALLGAYAVAKVTRNDVKIVYMPVEEIDAIRLAKSKSWKNGPLSAIPWYARKTVIKQLCKTLPKNRELARVMALFEREDDAELDELESPALDQSRQIASETAPRQRQLPPAVALDAPYDVDASGGVQVNDVEGQPAPARTNAQRATAETAARMADPYGSSPESVDEPSGPAAYPMPFKQGAAEKGAAIGTVSDKDLSDALRFAGDVAKYATFVEMAADELERRRLAAEDSEG